MADLEKGKIYQFDGNELVEIELSGERKLPVTDAAFTAVQQVRKKAHKAIGMRPDLNLCASAMLLFAAENQDIEQRVKDLGRQVYAS